MIPFAACAKVPAGGEALPPALVSVSPAALISGAAARVERPAASGDAGVALAPPLPEPGCASDADCGFAPAVDRCVADPGANRQPPLVDQGIVCYCDEGSRCATLRVNPTPCESDASCAVRLDPRPHPVAATPTQPHQRGRACRDFVFSTTCERTNICTMHRHTCPRPR